MWAVYTDNPDASVGKGVDLPYLAHYITMDGEYLYNLPTVMPGDDAAAPASTPPMCLSLWSRPTIRGR